MDASTQIAIEQAKASKKSPAVVWLGNLAWPGLGNLLVGQKGPGLFFGLTHWIWILITLVTFGLGAVFCVVNWAVASAVGHARINREFSESLGRIAAQG